MEKLRKPELGFPSTQCLLLYVSLCTNVSGVCVYKYVRVFVY